MMYYDVNKTMSRQRLFNFVVGPRGNGKTYGAKEYAIKNYLKRGEQFVYLRRYDTEMPAAEMRNFFDDIQDKFPEVEFKSYQGLFRINGQIAGWYFPLSKATMLKSIPFPNVKLIIFDEFIIEVGIYRYLPNEVRTFLECYSTISRDRDIPVLFLSNAITITNPYFLYFKLTFEEGQTLKLTKFISAEIIQNEEFSKHMMNTKFGQLIADTDYGQYNIQNKFILDTDTFISDMPPGTAYVCTFVVKNRTVGYYSSPLETLWYISDKIDNTCPRRFALEFSEHNTNSILAQKANFFIKSLTEKYCQGNLRFTTQEVKNLMTDILRRLI